MRKVWSFGGLVVLLLAGTRCEKSYFRLLEGLGRRLAVQQSVQSHLFPYLLQCSGFAESVAKTGLSLLSVSLEWFGGGETQPLREQGEVVTSEWKHAQKRLLIQRILSLSGSFSFNEEEMTMQRLLFSVLIFCAIALPLCAAEYEVATFEVDVTPPLGHPTIASLCGPAKEIGDPLWVKGLILRGTEQPVVVAAVDWCEIRNKSYDLWRDRIAKAAGTVRQNVMLSSVHQHDAPLSDNEAQDLMDKYGSPGAIIDRKFQEQCLVKVETAIQKSLLELIPVTHYGLGQAKVEQIASNRRTKNKAGKIGYYRGSFTGDLAIRNQPAGEIDPFLKTISFWNGDKPVVAVSTYAVHPMSYYCRGVVSSDFVGMGRQKRQEQMPGVFQIYCSGCSGDITASKYNSGDYAGRVALADRLCDGMAAAWEKTERFPLSNLGFRVHKMKLSPRSAKGFSISAFESVLANPQAPFRKRLDAALGISWLNRVARDELIDVPLLDFGNAKWMILPAESFVGYQLEAQKLVPDAFVMIAGYGECAPGYLPTRLAISEHFDDHHGWCQVSKTVHDEMTAALKAVLQVK